ncbi:MAG: hypothetical protein LBB90_08900 [Tannerella sp.]|jgi:hypothetical protein|nr:hypothetical protein [Tannerella sp.]
MAVLSWGKPLIEITPLGVNDEITNWIVLPIPKQDTSQLNTEAGNKTNATEEGGGLVDTRSDKSNYSFQFQLFAKKGYAKPIADMDGVVLTNYAVRLTPEDATAEGFIIEKASVSVLETWTAADGKLWQYTFDGLVPANGAILKPYKREVLAVTPAVLSFGNAEDSTGQAITATATGTLTATSDQPWATVTVAGNVATVTVAANTGAARMANITLTADGKTAVVPVTQAAA